MDCYHKHRKDRAKTYRAAPDLEFVVTVWLLRQVIFVDISKFAEVPRISRSPFSWTGSGTLTRK